MTVLPASSHARCSRRSGGLLIAAALICLSGLAGCYERVVEAHGPGASRTPEYEPNLREDERIPIVDDVGDALSGPPREKETGVMKKR